MPNQNSQQDKEWEREFDKEFSIKELQSKEFQQDLYSLYALLKSKKVSCSMRLHPAFEAKVQVKKLLGYYPTGEHQILIEKDGNTYSVIRGLVSFGNYEIMKIKGDNKRFEDPERFSTPEELVESLLK